ARLGEAAVKIPLVAAIVGEEIVDDLVEAVPVAAVVGVGGLRPGDGDVAVGVALADGVPHGLVGTGEDDLHEGAMVGPRRIVVGLPGFLRRVGNDAVPIVEGGLPLLV